MQPASSLRVFFPSQTKGCAQTAFYFDRDSGVLYHWSAMSAAGSFQDIMGTLQWSTDCVSRDSPAAFAEEVPSRLIVVTGRDVHEAEDYLVRATTVAEPSQPWGSKPLPAVFECRPDHGIEHQIVVTIIKSRKGEVLIPCDHWGMELPYGPMLGDQSIIQHAPIGRVADPSAWSVNASSGPAATSTQSHHTSLVELRNGSFAAIGARDSLRFRPPLAFCLSTD